MSAVMMMLGPYRFSIRAAAYQALERQTAYSWARQPRIGANDQLQYVGPGAETIWLDGVIYPHYAGGLAQLDKMRLAASVGLPLPLITGRGRVLGFWVIESVREGQTIFEIEGAPLRQEFGLGLGRYDGGLASILRI